LSQRGGNSIRTWGVDGLTRSVLNEADKYGLTVMLGLWMNKEKDGFDYDNEEKVKQQLENFRLFVRSFKDHPALLAWSIGNEVDLAYSNLNVWNAVNDIALMIKEEDGQHPTLTITAGISNSKANAIAARAPALDMLGVNAYASISSVHSTITGSNWRKPYLITEWGVNGPWEVSKTSWGAPLEPNSSEKAATFLSRYQQYIVPHQDVCPGSYAFYWNNKFEATQTWFGLLLGAETTEMVDALQYAWTGITDDNLAPHITSVKINGMGQHENVRITSKINNQISVEANDPDGDTLNYEYLIMPESGDDLVENIPGATFDAIPGIIVQTDSMYANMDFQDTHNKLNLRLYILVRDGKGHLATASFPFQTTFTMNTGYIDPMAKNGVNDNDWCTIWPNPADKFLNIQTSINFRNLEVSLYNLSGYPVIFQHFFKSDEPFSLDISRLSSGLYFLKISDGMFYMDHFKIIKQ